MDLESKVSAEILNNIKIEVLNVLKSMTPTQIVALIHGISLEPQSIERDKIEFTKKANALNDKTKLTILNPKNKYCYNEGESRAYKDYVNYTVPKESKNPNAFTNINEVILINTDEIKSCLEELNILAGQFPHLKFIITFREEPSTEAIIVLFLDEFQSKYKGIDFNLQNKFTFCKLDISLRSNLFTLTKEDLGKINVIKYFQENNNFQEISDFINKK